MSGEKRLPLIIHISGASGAGKSYLSDKLKKKLKNKIIVKDLDVLRNEFIKFYYGNKKFTNWDKVVENKYQSFINSYIARQNKPIVFVGLNDNTVFGTRKNLYYKLYSEHNFYIDLDSQILIQKCLRLLDDIQNVKDFTNKKLIKLFSDAIERECNIKMNSKWKKDYTRQGYKFMSSENIEQAVLKILSTK